MKVHAVVVPNETTDMKKSLRKKRDGMRMTPQMIQQKIEHWVQSRHQSTKLETDLKKRHHLLSGETSLHERNPKRVWSHRVVMQRRER
jgi:hypothetical protein